MNRCAKAPDWMSASTARMFSLTCGVDDPRARHVVAVLGGVRDAPALLGDAALVHEVDDQLQLVQALEVGDLRLVAGLGQHLEAGLDQHRRTAAQHGLLAEQVGLGLLGERGLDPTGAQGADRLRVGQRQVPRTTGRVLLHGDDRGHAAPGHVLAADQVTRALRGHHAHVDVGRRLHVAEADVEPVGEEQRVPGLEVRGDRLGVQAALGGVRDQDHDHVGLGARRGRVDDPQALGLGLGPALRALGQADAHVDPRVAQAQRVGVALAAVSEHRDLAALDDREVGVVVVVQLSHCGAPRVLRRTYGAGDRGVIVSGGGCARRRRSAGGAPPWC